MSKTAKTHTSIIHTEGNVFYLLFNLDGSTSVRQLRSRLNGTKYVGFETISGADVTKNNYLIFPDTLSHSEALQQLAKNVPSTKLRAVSAGVIQCNPTHEDETLNLFGKSATLQLGVEPDDAANIRSLYNYLLAEIKE